ncbi:MAG: asparagine synthase (glutamine-hydrolyzing) [Pseudomonadota bacterium]
MAHRGLDGEGTWSDGAVGLGHRRLAIRGLGDVGKQPMLNKESNVCVSYNGEIYNYHYLKEKLQKDKGCTFYSNCDTELLPHGWRAWGERLFDYLEGMYAIAIWDMATGTLVLARDGIGIKPLFYGISHDTLFFSSEIKGLLATGHFAKTADAAQFLTYLSNGYTGPDKTLSKAMHQVPPGTYICFSNGKQIKEKQFWRPQRNPIISDMGDALAGLSSLMQDVCSDMLISDVPLGLLLSSGIDSSLIALTVNSPLTCYTASFDQKVFDESAAAEVLAKTAGHHWISEPVASGHSVVDDFYAIAHAVDGQLADSSCLAHYALSRSVRQKFKVALAGDGADEFFGGYPTYKASQMASLLAPCIPNKLLSGLGALLGNLYPGDEGRLPWHSVLSRFLYGMTAPDTTYHAEWRRLCRLNDIQKISTPYFSELLRTDPLSAYRQAFLQAEGRPEDKCLLADERYYLPADMIVKVDRMSMAHGLEIRVPFLDRRIMDYAGTLNHRLLFSRLGKGKKILRKMATALKAPDSLVKAKKKGFNIPLSRLLRTDLKPVGDSLLHDNPDIFSPFLDADKLRHLWDAHINKKVNADYLLWSLLLYGAWQYKK